MERNRGFCSLSGEKTSQKRKWEEEDETLDPSKAKQKPVDKKKRSNGEMNEISVDAIKCSVCLDTVSSLIMKCLPCAHVFHEICIDEWLKKSNICPICRWPTGFHSNYSPHMGADGTRETFENSEDELNVSVDSDFGGFNNDLEEWTIWTGLEESTEVSESDEPSDESELEEPGIESELDEPRNESELDESRNESELDESSDDSESDKHSEEGESEDFGGESVSGGWSEDDTW